MQIAPDLADVSGCCRVVWIGDFKPDERTSVIEPLMDAGCGALARNLPGGERAPGMRAYRGLWN
ncbi:hypothetical protein [Paraburkholderia lycopersici]|uniref:Uncharacterized protein n=1 Tax=Paraburkholderia lycopersici TaxID=416944 RepID=A0A1G6PHW6_9BURK|nr:hypothetical protein [Paraburkholderia lycopersici]SDC79832.1 hypothetical protein SAMN05421548_110157 [Paraburkholderia lycopersici]